MNNYLLLAFCLMAGSCSFNDAQKIIDRSIQVHGGDRFLNSTIEFDFRDRHYKAIRNAGQYTYERFFTDSLQTIRDVLSNEGFYREVNGQPATLADSMAAKYARSVNSVIYFALLPYGLNDPAVKKKLLGTSTIAGQPYHKIEITFAQEGGGEDFSDVFHYWVHQKAYTIDYFSYSYHTDGGGIRFRKAFNPRIVNGILFQDYINYEPSLPSSLDEMEEGYKENKLKELSKIQLINIEVK